MLIFQIIWTGRDDWMVQPGSNTDNFIMLPVTNDNNASSFPFQLHGFFVDFGYQRAGGINKLYSSCFCLTYGFFMSAMGAQQKRMITDLIQRINLFKAKTCQAFNNILIVNHITERTNLWIYLKRVFGCFHRVSNT